MREGQAACALGPRTECSEPREHQLATHFSKAAQRPRPSATERASGKKAGYQEGQGPGEEPVDSRQHQGEHQGRGSNCWLLQGCPRQNEDSYKCTGVLSLSKTSLQIKKWGEDKNNSEWGVLSLPVLQNFSIYI